MPNAWPGQIFSATPFGGAFFQAGTICNVLRSWRRPRGREEKRRYDAFIEASHIEFGGFAVPQEFFEHAIHAAHTELAVTLIGERHVSGVRQKFHRGDGVIHRY